MESRHCGQDKRIFFCPVHNASTPCSLQAFRISCIVIFVVLVGFKNGTVYKVMMTMLMMMMMIMMMISILNDGTTQTVFLG